MDATTIGVYADLIDIFVKITVLIGAVWGVYKFMRYRELKQRIQLDIDINVYKLAVAEEVEMFNWDKEGRRVTVPVQQLTHAVEVLLKFNNRGFTRMRLFNIQIGVNTMRQEHKALFDEEDGHLHLTRVFTSGNIVPQFPVDGKPIEKTSFYYIEPGVQQTIMYLTLIPAPRDLVQIFAQFSMEQKRIFPQRSDEKKGLYPHTAARTFKLDSNGALVK